MCLSLSLNKVYHILYTLSTIIYTLYNIYLTLIYIVYTLVSIVYTREKEVFKLLQIHDIIDNEGLTTDEKITAIEAFLKEDLINVKEALEILDVTRTTANRYIEDGSLRLLVDKGQFKVLSKIEVANFKPTVDATKEFFKKKAPK